jgi:hypothetical protein
MSPLRRVEMSLSGPFLKGRVERVHGTLQDRLVKEIRLEGISTIPDANGKNYENLDDAFTW